jgi:hypothetical protein
MLARNDLAQYIADNYGRCKLDPHCLCLRSGAVSWYGCACSKWVPTTATTLAELREEMIRAHNLPPTS